MGHSENLDEEGGNVRDEQAKHGTQTFINFSFEVWAFKAEGSDFCLGGEDACYILNVPSSVEAEI